MPYKAVNWNNLLPYIALYNTFIMLYIAIYDLSMMLSLTRLKLLLFVFFKRKWKAQAGFIIPCCGIIAFSPIVGYNSKLQNAAIVVECSMTRKCVGKFSIFNHWMIRQLPPAADINSLRFL